MGENKNPKKQIFPQMFDVRPTDELGNLDLEKIEKIERIVEISKKEEIENVYFGEQKEIKKMEDLRRPDIFDDELKRFHEMMRKEEEDRRKKKRRIEISGEDIENVKNISVEFESVGKENDFFPETAEYQENNFETPEQDYTKEKSLHLPISETFKKNFFFLGKISLAGAIIIILFVSANTALKMKNGGLAKGQSAMAELASAKDDIKKGNFDESYIKFSNANEKLTQVSEDLGVLGGTLANFTKYIPYLSKVSSGSNIIKGGKNISEAGKLISEILKNLDDIKKGANQNESVSYLELFQNNEVKLKKISILLREAEDSLESVNLDDIPENNRVEFMRVKNQLPIANNSLEKLLDQERILVDILGGNGPRKYLFLFQNNQEMRATGGFIGSYGMLDIFNGRVRKFFIDGIFNPDGQLKEKIVPPTPIQKISAAWSLHDSNWFPDFPVSAEKASSFYEKTGGPTVDGVIAMTPTVMQKLLEITGPIEMPEYDVIVDKDNFVEKIQYEVEVDYDKELNQPKKILSDLAPKVLDKIFNSNNFSDISKTANILLESLNEKQILIYSKNFEIEKILSKNGWSGEILDTPKDYVSVINTNINGFKTDGIVDENITHEASIQEDGTIIDTLTITRHHNGGDSQFDWWNKVNANYMRVYVPKGSRLISVEGQTREFNTPPLDYNALGFKRDPQIQMEEDSMKIDEESGTRIYEDGGKTVFANWAYVSPKETVTIKYVYALPFTINLNTPYATGAYSLLAQKQAGSFGSKFISKISYPDSYKISWQYPEGDNLKTINLPNEREEARMEDSLITDKFVGLAFSKK
ncbi:MAG TPA: DUF4012 domain-containing protein [Candidatus Moranbacteria bacterium]|nr:DUF4012 domain-containing protein [Candidatus Moranbacteria bacterium]